MSRLFGSVVAALALVTGSLLIAAPAYAATVTWDGALTEGEATWFRPSCNSVTNSVEWWQEQSFTVDQDGLYSIEMITSAGITEGSTPDGFFMLYETSFDPAVPSTNCLATDDDAGSSGLNPALNAQLTAGTKYTLVTTQCCDGITADQAMTYTNQITGPGSIVLTFPTTITLAASPTTVTAGAPFTLTATVAGTTTGSDLSGTVEFFNGTVSLGTATVNAGTALLAAVTLPEGTHAITAVYSGNAGAMASTSAPVEIIVSEAVPIPDPTAPTPPKLVDTGSP